MTIYYSQGVIGHDAYNSNKSVTEFLKDYSVKEFGNLGTITADNVITAKKFRASYAISGMLKEDSSDHAIRNNSNMIYRDALFLDLDDVNPEIKDEKELLTRIYDVWGGQYTFFAWPTISNNLGYTKENGQRLEPQLRYRVCLPLEEHLDEFDYKAALKIMLDQFVEWGILTRPDNTNFTWDQLAGLPINQKPYYFKGAWDQYHFEGYELELARAEMAEEEAKKKATQKPFFTVPKTTTDSGMTGETGLSVPEAIHKVLKEGPKWQAIWKGDWRGQCDSEGNLFKSQSEVDLALANKLCFYLGYDLEAIDEAFRNSALMRDKWDEDHYNNEVTGVMTYGRHTIMQAIAGVAKVWSKGFRNKPTVTYNFGPEILYGSKSFEDIAASGLHSANELAGFLNYMLSHGVKTEKAINLAFIANDHTTPPLPETTLIETINTALTEESQRRNGGVM